MNRAVELLAEKRSRGPGRGRGAAQPPLKELGEHPDEGGPVNVLDGRYGPYVKWQKVNATIPKSTEPEALTMDEALATVAGDLGPGLDVLVVPHHGSAPWAMHSRSIGNR